MTVARARQSVGSRIRSPRALVYPSVDPREDQMAANGNSLTPAADVLFEPLRFHSLTIKNRVFRSNISGRFDNYDGSGNQARINWELKFARGGVGAIVSSFVPVLIGGRVIPHYPPPHRAAGVSLWWWVA